MDILCRASKGVEVKLGNEAEAAWRDRYYSDLTKDRPDLCGCATNRGEAQALRLAMIYCLLDRQSIITLDHLEAGIAFWNYCNQSANYIFHSMQRDMTAQLILEALKKGSLTATDIYGLFGNNATKAKLEAALSELTASGQIVSEKQDNPKGRPTLVFYFSEKLN